jgi:hypothetical protein
MTRKPLTEREKLIRDMDGLRDSIKLAGPEILKASNAQERKQILDHVGWCQKELAELKTKLKSSN